MCPSCLSLLPSQVGSTSLQLAEKQVIFGSVPLNMPSIRTAVLHNTGQNHAYYQVPTHIHTRMHMQHCFYTDACTHQTSKIAYLYFSVCMRQVVDVCPLPGMVVSPSEGVVPSGGQGVVNIHFKPDSVSKFDTRVKVRESWVFRQSFIQIKIIRYLQ